MINLAFQSTWVYLRDSCALDHTKDGIIARLKAVPSAVPLCELYPRADSQAISVVSEPHPDEIYCMRHSSNESAPDIVHTHLHMYYCFLDGGVARGSPGAGSSKSSSWPKIQAITGGGVQVFQGQWTSSAKWTRANGRLNGQRGSALREQHPPNLLATCLL